MGIVLGMLLLSSGFAWAQPEGDVQSNWAAEQIGSWLDQGLAHGYPDGTNTPTKIKLVLTNKMTSAGSNVVTFTYTKGADAASQIISTEGGILESFTQPYTQTI